MEEWRPVVGFETVYEVSSEGRVKRVGDRRHGAKIGRILKPAITQFGYEVVGLYDRARYMRRFVHHLVLCAFVGPRQEGHEGRHLNGDRRDNRPSNLAWGTRADNEADKVKLGRSNRGERCGTSKLTQQQVEELRQLAGTGLSTAALGKRFGVSQSQASRIVRRERWAHV